MSYDFSNIAKEYWDKKGSFSLLHSMNTLRVSMVKEYSSVKGKNILDIGCGGGLFTEEMARSHAVVTGIDKSQKMIDIANEHKGDLAIDYLCNTEYKKKKKFDIITCFELVEHLTDEEIEKILKNIQKCIVPNGLLFISTINRTVASFVKSILFSEVLTGKVPLGTHVFKDFITPSELVNEVEKYAFKPLAIKGMDYSLLFKKWYYAKPDNCYSVCFQFSEEVQSCNI